ncbi:MAG: hypothetical protein K2G50_01690 [Anaeroplasmataceae bacterium]|nr:hypothetical protein [Anaeroplasmataceae bacterium]
MSNIVEARLFWISKEDGGRESIVIGDNLKYCPIISFDDCPLEKKYSSKITKSILKGELITDVELTYLVDSAPFENLQSNKKFKLYEGNMLVAKGVIL